jgi:ribosome biogenesis GTPase / thiamine phosphate phosphatase
MFRVLEASHGLALVSLVPPSLVSCPPDVSVVCGDLVSLDDTCTRIVAVAPRRTALARARMDGDEQTGVQVICANVDVVAVCAPLDRPISERFLERGIAIAHASGARPLVLLTKRDVVDAVEDLHVPGVDVLAVSAHDRGVDAVRAVRAVLAAGETMALLGASGAGKSTLANALLGEERAHEHVRTGDVRTSDARGRHTTTGARLLSLPWGAFLVDTAGVRTLGLVGDEDDVGAAFPDIDALAADCRFRDCSHQSEPGCAVRAAVDAGQLDEARVQSFHGLMREAARRARKAWEHGDERALSIAGWQRARDKRR